MSKRLTPLLSPDTLQGQLSSLLASLYFICPFLWGYIDVDMLERRSSFTNRQWL
jgi:hypothetical protein